VRVRYLFSTAVCLLLLVPVSRGAADIRVFPFSKEVQQPDGEVRNVAAFRLDEEIFAASDDGYANVRLFDAEGNEKPFLVRTAKTKKTETVEHAVLVETAGFQKLPDNSVEVIYSLKKEAGAGPSAIVFVTTLKNYEKQVTVWGSNDKDSWELLAEKSPIFDYTRFIDVRNARVAIKAGSYAYYKVLVSNITENQQSPFVGIARETRDGALASEIENSSFRREDFRMDRVDFIECKEMVVRSKALMRAYPVNSLSVTNDVKEKTTTVTFDTGRVPVTALKIVCGSSNFSRAMRFERSAEGAGDDEWQRVMSSNISSIDAGGFKQNGTEIQLGCVVRSGRCRIVIENRDSPPLNITGVEVQGEIHEALFFPEAAAVFSVMYGAEGLAAPVYDIAEVLAKVEGADVTLFSLGQQRDNPQYDVLERQPIKGRALLIVAILLMVLVLGWIISRAVKRLDAAPVVGQS